MQIVKNNIGLLEFYKYFDSEEKCYQYLHDLKYADGRYCPFCENKEVWVLNRKKLFRCGSCKKNFTLTSKTAFHKSYIPLRTWFYVLYEQAFSGRSVSSTQFSKKHGMRIQTMWTMQNNIRKRLYQNTKLKLKGTIEIDEVYMSKYGKSDKISNRKTPILGMLERNGSVIIKPIRNRGKKILDQAIQRHIIHGSTIYTDGHESYKYIQGYKHEFVDHRNKEYVRGDVHTNTIEGLWGRFKTSIRTAHHYITGKYIRFYCDEIAYHYNTRNMTPVERFDDMLNRMLHG